MVCSSSLRQSLQTHWVTARSTTFVFLVPSYTVRAVDLGRGDGALRLSDGAARVKESNIKLCAI